MNSVYSSLLCCVANHGALEKSRALDIFSRIHQANHQGANRRSIVHLDEAIAEINRNISRFDQKIVEINYSLPGAEAPYITFISTSESAISKQQNLWNPAEVELFRLMLREITTADDHKRSIFDCINLAGKVHVRQISKTRAEKVIQKWILTGYFYEQDEDVHLGPRLIAEFGTNLRTYFKDYVNMCDICKAIVFWGPRCGNCEELFHKECLDKCLSRIQTCPSCKETFKSPV
ncbi:non-structural maintenance of chromosomes element 1 homolog [Culicoides brevitarsis]|uniref:non-structural maintenance of chromosomes element 1 homolog n=1 Tax=Culicoides brevitarsis TaxID=469753 RepID=UPI00307B7650